MASQMEKIEKELDDKIKKDVLEIFPHISEQAVQRRITHHRSTWEFPLNPSQLLQLCISDFLDRPIATEDLVAPFQDTVDSSNTLESAIKKLDEDKLLDSDDDLLLIEAVNLMNRDSQSSFNSDVIVLDSIPIAGHNRSGQTSDLTRLNIPIAGHNRSGQTSDLPQLDIPIAVHNQSGQTSDLTRLDHNSDIETSGQLFNSEMHLQSGSRTEMKEESTNWDEPLPKIQFGGHSVRSTNSPSVPTDIKLNSGICWCHNINAVKCLNSSSATTNVETSAGKSTSVLSLSQCTTQQSSNIPSANLTGSSSSRPLGPSQLVSFSPNALTFSPNIDSVLLRPLPGSSLSSHCYLDNANIAVSAIDPSVALSSQTHFHNKLSQTTNMGHMQALNQPKMNTCIKSNISNQPLPRLLSKTSMGPRTSNKDSYSLGPIPSLTPSSLSASPLSSPQPQNMIKPAREIFETGMIPKGGGNLGTDMIHEGGGILGTEMIHKDGGSLGTEMIYAGDRREQQWKHNFQGDSYIKKGTNNFGSSALDAVNKTFLGKKILDETFVQMHIPEHDANKAAITSATDMCKRMKPPQGLTVQPKYGPLPTMAETFLPANNPAMQLSLVKDNPPQPQINQQTIPPSIPTMLTTTAPSAPKDPYQGILQEVLVMFPDVDPSYVLEFLKGKQNSFLLNTVCNYLLETNYPRVKNSAEALFTDIMPIIDYYRDYKSIDNRTNKNYIGQCTELLTTEFKWVAACNIQQVMKLFQFCYAPSHRALTRVWKTAMEKVPAGQSPSGFQFTTAIETDTRQVHITFRLLKHSRKSKIFNNLDPQLQREVEFVKLKNIEEVEEMDYQLALKMNENEYEELGQQIECGCCYGEFAFETLVQCYDGHLFCGDCLKKYAEESVFGQGKAELSCMTDSCTATFPLSQLMKALPSQIISKYEDRIQEENISLADLKDLVRCPFCDFAALLDSTYTVFSCQNSSCMKESCRHCQVEWSEHFGKKCSDIEKKDETKLRLEFEEKMTLAKIRVCPKCKTKFTKIDGCNKMTCRCGAKMCYICRQPNIDYNHFCRHPRDPGMSCNVCQNCSLWTNPDVSM